MAKLYFAKVNHLKNDFDSLILTLPQYRKEKVLSYKMEKDQILSLGAYLLLKEAMKEEGVDISNLIMEYGEHGKPYFKNINKHFNLSHSGEYVLCVIGDTDVGCDIQKQYKKNTNIANHFFTSDEKREILNDEDFYKIWVMKESYIKCTGKGLNCSLKSFSVSFRKPSNLGYSLQFLDILPDYMIGYCGKEEITLIKDIKL